jgi:hypothetical protein
MTGSHRRWRGCGATGGAIAAGHFFMIGLGCSRLLRLRSVSKNDT